MPRTCTVCSHPKREELDRAHLAGQPFAGIARDFAVSADAVERHLKAHLPPALTQAQKDRDAAGAEKTLNMLARITSEAVRLAEKAEKAGDLRTAAAVGVRELVRIAELTARLRGEIGGAEVAVTVNVNQSQPLEELNRRVTELKGRAYLRDPGGFVERVRRAAAEIEAVRRRIPYEQSRAELEAREREAATITLLPVGVAEERPG